MQRVGTKSPQERAIELKLHGELHYRTTSRQERCRQLKTICSLSDDDAGYDVKNELYTKNAAIEKDKHRCEAKCDSRKSSLSLPNVSVMAQ